jgi:hypothetical protein
MRYVAHLFADAVQAWVNNLKRNGIAASALTIDCGHGVRLLTDQFRCGAPCTHAVLFTLLRMRFWQSFWGSGAK